MNSASIAEIKKELKHQSEEELLKICLRLAQFKKENKELLSYILFESGNEEKYILKVKEDISIGINDMNHSNLYFAKKTIRKQLRLINKYIRFSGDKQTEVELLLFFSNELIHSGLEFKDSKVIMNLLSRLKNSIQKALNGLHEDIQYDYIERISVFDKIL